MKVFTWLKFPDTLYVDAGGLIEFVDGDEVAWHFIVFVTDLSNDFAGNALILASDNSNFLA
jgi:hypothetical protein